MQPPHLAHWPSHLPQSITVPATALPDNLETSARRYPDKAALVFFGRAMPYRELAHTAERLAAYLHSVGVRQGDRVILLMQNLPQLVAAHFAILRANAVVVPVVEAIARHMEPHLMKALATEEPEREVA